jgi:hypothetical protein
VVTLHHLAMTLSPVVTPVELRPRRIWFVLAALIAVGGVLVAAGVMLFVLRSGGDLGQRITPGQPVTVYLSPSNEKVVWAAKVTSQGVPDVRCPGSWLDDQTVRQVGFQNVYLAAEDVELEVDDERWRGVLALHGDPGGRYEVTCMASGAGPTPILSIGDPPRFYNARHGSRQPGSVRSGQHQCDHRRRVGGCRGCPTRLAPGPPPPAAHRCKSRMTSDGADVR